MHGSKEDFYRNNVFSLYDLYGHTLTKGAYPICPTCSITKTRPLKRKKHQPQRNWKLKRKPNVYFCIWYANKYNKISEKAVYIKLNECFLLSFLKTPACLIKIWPEKLCINIFA